MKSKMYPQAYNTERNTTTTTAAPKDRIVIEKSSYMMECPPLPTVNSQQQQ